MRGLALINNVTRDDKSIDSNPVWTFGLDWKLWLRCAFIPYDCREVEKKLGCCLEY